MKLQLFPLPGLSLTKFLSMISFKQRFGIDHQPLLDSTSGTCLNKQKIYSLGPIVVAQIVVGGQQHSAMEASLRQQPPTPDATLERYLIYTNYVILYLLIDIS